MENRKRCESCNEYLISMSGQHFHPDKPCSGTPDGLSIIIEVDDEFLNKKWLEAYGKPEIDDYDRLKAYEHHKWIMKQYIKKLKEELRSVKEHWLLKHLLKIFKL